MSIKKQSWPDNIEDPPSRDVLVASLLYLMSRYSRSPDAKVSRSIVDHLHMLEKHPDSEASLIERTAARLSKFWGQPSEQLGSTNVIDTKIH